MLKLYHHPLHPASRFIRLVMAEKHLDFELREEKFWQPTAEFLALSPSNEVPLLVADNAILTGAAAIAEYLDETHSDVPLLGPSPRQRLEVRRITHHYLYRFSQLVADLLLGERVWKRLAGQGEPDAGRLRFAFAMLSPELAGLNVLCERRKWLAGDHLSMADFAAASQLSALDYIGVVPWDEAPDAKDWYARLKSRPCFRGLLQDNVQHIPPAAHYGDLDF